MTDSDVKNSFNCFKFRRVSDHLLDSLENSTLYFSSREGLNDPFDSNIDIESIFRRFAEDTKNKLHTKFGQAILKDEKFFQRFHKSMEDFGICSFSIALHETLMWSHYGDEHKGVALEYDFPIGYLDDEDKFLGVSATTYDDNAISAWVADHIILFQYNHYEFVTGLLRKMLTSKAPAWSYEEEGRIIRAITGAFEIPREMLKGVTFGLRTSAKDEEMIRTVVDKNYEDIKYQRVVRGDSDFGLSFVDA